MMPCKRNADQGCGCFLLLRAGLQKNARGFAMQRAFVCIILHESRLICICRAVVSAHLFSKENENKTRTMYAPGQCSGIVVNGLTQTVGLSYRSIRPGNFFLVLALYFRLYFNHNDYRHSAGTLTLALPGNKPVTFEIEMIWILHGADKLLFETAEIGKSLQHLKIIL